MNRKIYSHGSHGGNGGDIDRTAHLTDHTEYRDLNFRAVGQFFVGLGVIVAISYFAMYGILALFESQYADNDGPPPPTADVGWQKPAIDVQTAPHLDLVRFREREDSVMRSADPARRKLSVDEAIALTLNEGLPYRSGTASDEADTAAPADEVDADAAAETDAEGTDNAQETDTSE